MNDDIYREMFETWPAWQILVGHVSCDDDASLADPQSVFGAACACDRDRLAALLYGNTIGGTLAEADQILGELLDLAVAGRRPRTWREMGLRPEMFEFGRDAA